MTTLKVLLHVDHNNMFNSRLHHNSQKPHKQEKYETRTSKHLDEVAENKKQLFNVHHVFGFQPQPIPLGILRQLRVRTAQLQTISTNYPTCEEADMTIDYTYTEK